MKKKETKTDIDNVRNECKANSVIHARNDKASLNEKIQQIETQELKELRKGFLILIRIQNRKFTKRNKYYNKVINTQTIFREEFLREISCIHKLIQQLDKKSKSLP